MTGWRARGRGGEKSLAPAGGHRPRNQKLAICNVRCPPVAPAPPSSMPHGCSHVCRRPLLRIGWRLHRLPRAPAADHNKKGSSAWPMLQNTPLPLPSGTDAGMPHRADKSYHVIFIVSSGLAIQLFFFFFFFFWLGFYYWGIFFFLRDGEMVLE